MRRTHNAKIVATLGPASSHPDVVRNLFLAGVDVFRLNCSHGNAANHRERFAALRAPERDFGRPVGILADLYSVYRRYLRITPFWWSVCNRFEMPGSCLSPPSATGRQCEYEPAPSS